MVVVVVGVEEQRVVVLLMSELFKMTYQVG